MSATKIAQPSLGFVWTDRRLRLILVILRELPGEIHRNRDSARGVREKICHPLDLHVSSVRAASMLRDHERVVDDLLGLAKAALVSAGLSRVLEVLVCRMTYEPGLDLRIVPARARSRS